MSDIDLTCLVHFFATPPPIASNWAVRSTIRKVGPLLQNVTNFTATDWYSSAMPRDPATGDPRPEAATVPLQRGYMDTSMNPAALNYTLHQALVTGLHPGKTYCK